MVNGTLSGFAVEYKDQVTQCNTTGVPEHGSMYPDKPIFDYTDKVYYSCNENYTLVGPSEAVCELGGSWNPPTPPTCNAGCITPVIDNGITIPDTNTVTDGQVITFDCHENFTIGGPSHTTCPDCPLVSESIVNGNIIGEGPPYIHGHQLLYECNANFTIVGPTEITCHDGIWSDAEPTCKAQCWFEEVPNSDSSSDHMLPHAETLRITCDYGYSSGTGQTTDVTCFEGVLSPSEHPQCLAQCNRPTIRASNATSQTPLLHHGDTVTVACDEGYSNGESQSMTYECNEGKLVPPVSFCYEPEPF
ncbi:C4b-binding protein alpha chain-like [Lytechinus variegatus]|uniref:C4b-binding protein alpha chain-like n=1 Tax=Lytechinus variegatus TaxID=7654 RepID=UPI001BB2B5EE|nr:C4b-binding protein alpha chain-like [Lytechinus variegatus]